ncbi:MAG: glycine cleavage T C-terminal barrel domain-containing protein [Thermoanaerobaculia bacterium]
METPPALPVRRLPLGRLWTALAAEMVASDGFERPLRFAGVEPEHRALGDGLALVDRSQRARLEVLGADRQRFLNGYLTCDVKALAPESAAYGFFPDAQGRVLADALVLALEDRIWLELPAGSAPAIEAHLGKYRLADRVEFRPLDDLVLVAIEGRRAPAWLARLGLEAPPPFAHGRARLGSTEFQLARDGRIARPRYLLWISASIAPALVEELLAAGASDGLVPAGLAASEIVRVEEGEALFGVDYGAGNFPQEIGAESAVSYTKGCYLGQEVISRLHFRGQPSRELRGVVFDESATAEVGVELAAEGRPAGRATSVVRSPVFGRALGLALLQRRAAAPGTRLALPGGAGAEVVSLPFRRADVRAI